MWTHKPRKLQYGPQCNPEVRYFLNSSGKQSLSRTFEAKRGHQVTDTFRKKRLSTCQELGYSSALNPFARTKFVRPDQPFKEGGNRKKRIETTSTPLTDPVLLRYEKSEALVRIKPDFNSSFQTKKLVERRSELPSERQFSENRKKYYSVYGLSNSLQKLPRQRQTQNSQKIKRIIEYSSANHAQIPITPKVGSFKSLTRI